jgi:hypothetical protein
VFGWNGVKWWTRSQQAFSNMAAEMSGGIQEFNEQLRKKGWYV